MFKITIFGAKIQIIYVIFAVQNSQKSWLFSLKIPIRNFEFFWKLNFRHFRIQFSSFWQCEVQDSILAYCIYDDYEGVIFSNDGNYFDFLLLQTDCSRLENSHFNFSIFSENCIFQNQNQSFEVMQNSKKMQPNWCTQKCEKRGLICSRIA